MFMCWQELRRKRAELSVALRKQARDEQLLKRRAMSPEAGEEIIPEKVLTPQEIVKGLVSGDLSTKIEAARAARKILSREQNPPITKMLEAGVLKPLIAALDEDNCTDLQFEVAWAITNIASGTHEHTVAVIDGGAVPKLVTLLSRGGTVGEQSAWGTREHSRRWCRAEGLQTKTPLVNFDLVAPALPTVSELLELSDQDVLGGYMLGSLLPDRLDPTNVLKQFKEQTNYSQRLINLLDHKTPAVKTPALRAVGNMLYWVRRTDRPLSSGWLPIPHCKVTALWQVLPHEGSGVGPCPTSFRRHASSRYKWRSTRTSCPHLLHVIANEDIKCQKEAAWAITNLCLGGAPEQLDCLLAAGFLEPYCALLSSPDHKAVTVVLEGLTNLFAGNSYSGNSNSEITYLNAAVKYGQVETLCLKLEEIGALDTIEILQQHENEQIYKKVLHILDTYFGEQDDVNAEPKKTDEQYQFGINPTNTHINF
ncbi:hypothetical protein ACJJTC_013576 [Scirpophaga incertulas]